jgi:hypothetical protein
MPFQDFIIAVVKALLWVGLVGFFTIVIGRALWIRWSRRWQFAIKYNIMKAKVDPVKAEWIFEALNRGINHDKMKMKLLIAGFSMPDIHEMLWLANKISNELELKGGKNGTGKQFKTIDRANENRKLPIH